MLICESSYFFRIITASFTALDPLTHCHGVRGFRAFEVVLLIRTGLRLS